MPTETCRATDFGCEVWWFGCGDEGVRVRVWGLGFGGWGVGVKVWRLGCRCLVLRVKVNLRALQGYLTHKKTHPPRTLPQA